MAGERSKTWAKRESLREKGQFWTPPWVAEAMVAYASTDSRAVLDPAFGAGAFAIAGRTVSEVLKREIRFHGCELHKSALVQAQEAGVREVDLNRVTIGDFLSVSSLPRGVNIVANPPYIRHHRLSVAVKRQLRRIATANIGFPLDGRTGLHVYFLIHALSLLGKGRSLCFILPSDVCEGVFAHHLWTWIARKYCIEGVVTFEPDATPFPGVDTNPIVLMIRNATPSEDFVWARIKRPGGADLLNWMLAGCPVTSGDAMFAESRNVAVALRNGLSRLKNSALPPEFVLGDFVRVMRGVATGANDFFCLTSQRARELKIPNDFLVRCVGRTRDVPGDEVLLEDLDSLDSLGRETYLLIPDGRPIEEFPAPLRTYLTKGIELGLSERSLIAQRKPWYKMERRIPPPFLFAYLGRRTARFIRNTAEAWPLTGFLCIYTRGNDREINLKLERLLCDPMVTSELDTVAKSYGGGALKVEPRALERLPVCAELVHRLGLAAHAINGDVRRAAGQLTLTV